MTQDSHIQIIGDPVASFEVLGLPSINTFNVMHHFAKAKMSKEFREQGERIGRDIVGWQDTPLIRRVLLVVRVWVPHEGIMDIHNVYIKPVLDGLTDAGVYEDDEWAFVPAVLFLWAGVGTELLDANPPKRLTWKEQRRVRARRTVFDLYELSSVSLNGEFQKLPKGRRKV